MDASLKGKEIRIRPHAKSHKCPEIALRQIRRGAVGVCCQKVSEAEAMVDGGVPDVLIANEVVGAPKLKHLAALAKRARVAVCADDTGNVTALAGALDDALQGPPLSRRADSSHIPDRQEAVAAVRAILQRTLAARATGVVS